MIKGLEDLQCEERLRETLRPEKAYNVCKYMMGLS